MREIANFGAHTQADDQAEIIDVSVEEAEWTLEIVERLFDYFIVTPEKNKETRETFDQKLKADVRRLRHRPMATQGTRRRLEPQLRGHHFPLPYAAVS